MSASQTPEFFVPFTGITGKDVTLSNISSSPPLPTSSNKIVSLQKEVCMTRYILFRRSSNDKPNSSLKGMVRHYVG